MVTLDCWLSSGLVGLALKKGQHPIAINYIAGKSIIIVNYQIINHSN